MLKWFSRRFVDGSSFANQSLRLWHHRSRGFFEELEDRRLLSIAPTWDYDLVSPDWFDIKVDPVTTVAESFNFVGPLTLEQFEARSALFSKSESGDDSQDQWIVRLTPEATELLPNVLDAERLLGTPAIDFHIIRGLGLPGQLLVDSSNASAQEAELALEANPLVAYCTSNGPITAQVLPDDPDFSELWGLDNTGQTGGSSDADIDALEAWDITTGSSSVVVAVIDSGIDYTHPDLYRNVWLNQGEIPAAFRSELVDTDSDGLITFYDLNEPANAAYVADSNMTGYVDAADLLADSNWADGVDDDGNKYADDLVGWNFSGVGEVNDPFDESRHGTHVSGTIAATGNDQVGTTGVMWRASIMPLKFLDEANRGSKAEAIAAINYLTLMRNSGVNVVVANNSWGYRGESDPNLRSAIAASAEANILFVAAAGNGDILGHGVDNDEDPRHAFYPASEDLESILTVAASDDDDRLARFSNYGVASVDIAAPGVSIFSTDPNGGYRSRYGTSMAAPHVSGVAGLVWSVVPDATAAEVKEAILQGSDLLPGSQDQDKLLSGKRLNAYGSLLVDTAAPRASLESVPNVDGPGVTESRIVVHFRDNRLVDLESVETSQLLVTDVEDPSTTYYATFESVDVTVDSQECTATYLLRSPKEGGWETLNNGDYEVSLGAGQIQDTAPLNPRYNSVPETILGTFNVDTTPGLIRVSSFADGVDQNPGDGVADDGTGHASLRAAIIEANSQTTIANVIRLVPGTYALSISGRGEDNGLSGDLDILHSLTISGAGADVTTIDASNVDRVFQIHPGVTVELAGVSLIGGNPQADGGGLLNEGTLTLTSCQVSESMATFGGALSNGESGVATIEACTLYDNTASSGGAIDNRGELSLTNSTLSGNSATTNGGGLSNRLGTVTVTNATLAANSADNGGGIANEAAITLLNTIVADNSALSNPDVFGSVDSHGTNLVGAAGTSTGWTANDLLNTDPLLGPLTDNTGTTLTHALLVDSPAIDAGVDVGALSTDQRGISRPQDALVGTGTSSSAVVYSANMDTDPSWTFDSGSSPYQWEWGDTFGRWLLQW